MTMRSAGAQVAALVNRTAVPYVPSRQTFAQAFTAPQPMLQELQAMGSVGTLFGIVTRLAQPVSMTEWGLWRKSRSGKPEDRTPVTNHVALKIWQKPNDFMTCQELTEITGQHQELVGEQWWVIARSPLSPMPLELWPVRPDKMRPIPDPDDYIVGYVYTGPSGEQIPLEVNQVIFMRSPDPMSAYRGMGPVGSILPDLNATTMSARYIANFFTNSARPGGIIEVDKTLTDEEFDTMTRRWRESHQGVDNAHRVAILEQGKWVETSFSLRDMQFSELRSTSSEVIREAFGFPKPMLGSVDDVNRANAEAMEYIFAKWLLVPRLERIKQALNNEFLPLFFPPGATPDVEFDYVSPVPEDKQFDQTNLKAKADTAKVWIDLGFAVPDVLEYLDVPDMEYEKPAPPPQFAAPGQPPTDPAPDDDEEDTDPAEKPPPPGSASNRHRPWPTPTAARRLNPDDAPDLTPVQDSWQRQVTAALAAYAPVLAGQTDDLIRQIEDVVSSGSRVDLLHIATASTAGAAVLQQAMIATGAEAAGHVVTEAADQGVTIQPVQPRRDGLTEVAVVTAGLMAGQLALSAVREAFRVWGQGGTAALVGKQVRDALGQLSDAGPRQAIGGALTRAQRDARLNTLAAAPTTAWYASEVLDANTCKNCRAVDGKWLGNSIIENVNRLYPTGGYIDCLGRDRCRGMVVGVWRPKQVGAE